MAKKMISVILAMLLMMASAAFAEGTAHTHAPAEEWERDLQQHWHTCECGEKLEAEDHVYGDYRCTVCSSEVWIFDDGSGEVYTFDEYDGVVRTTAYDAEGLAAMDTRYVLEYTDGFCTREEMYQDGNLVSVTEYAMHKDGYGIPVNQTVYYEDGTRGVTENDEYGNCVHSVEYDTGGTVLFESFGEYTYDEEGSILHTKETGYFGGVLSFELERNQYSDSILDIYYAEDGTVEFGTRSEYEYDEDGYKLWEKNYDVVTGRLKQESIYAFEIVDDWEQNYEKTFIYYEEDGSMYICEYDENGSELSAGLFDENGDPVSKEDFKDE